MDDQLDKDLSKRIKEVFDNYEDASANEGWLKLREKFPEEKRRRSLIWLWAAAALLLLFLGIGLVKLFNTQPDKANNIVRVKPVKQGLPTLNTHKESIVAHNAVPSQPQTHTSSNKPNIAESGKTAVAANTITQNMHAQTTVNKNKAITQNNTASAYLAPPQSSAKSSANNNLTQAIGANQQPALLARVDTAKKTNITVNNNATQLTVATETNAVTKTVTSASQPAVAAKKPSGIDEMFAADQGKTPDDTQLKMDKRVKFGVYAATYINYAKNGNNQVNAGGGFTAAIPLTKNLKFVTGASVNQNSFNYNNQMIFASAFPAAVAYMPKVYSNFSNATPTSYSHDASLLGIDVPFNLQYQFNTRKNPVYILGGISSGTFINESYSYLYANGSSQQFQTNKGLNDFYFARTLNFGFGVGYPVGRSQIVIEPFLKYPLEGMGSQQLKFGASGINLKFNFSTKK